MVISFLKQITNLLEIETKAGKKRNDFIPCSKEIPEYVKTIFFRKRSIKFIMNRVMTFFHQKI